MIYPAAYSIISTGKLPVIKHNQWSRAEATFSIHHFISFIVALIGVGIISSEVIFLVRKFLFLLNPTLSTRINYKIGQQHTISNGLFFLAKLQWTPTPTCTRNNIYFQMLLCLLSWLNITRCLIHFFLLFFHFHEMIIIIVDLHRFEMRFIFSVLSHS